ncbi:hypothetical protein BH23BAC2_BH23BAC2_20870 [soil metagenome]
MKFKSRIDKLTQGVILGSIVIMYLPLWGVWNSEMGTGTLLIILFIVGISAILLWLLFGTYYVLEDDHLVYHNGPFNGKIPIKSIRKIIKDKTLWVGYRPATARKGVIVKYQKYDEIYFSPEDNETFIEALLKLNPGIEVEE